MIGTLAGIGAVAAGASFAGLHTMVPWSQLYGANFNGEARPSQRLALTYDDGPNDPHTFHLLDVLARHDVKATFFMVGQFVRQRPQIARAVAEAGHTIGNHTYTHPNLIFVSTPGLCRQIEDTTKAIEDATGQAPKLFRPPFGGRRPGTFATAREYGMTPVMWRVTCFDWSAKSNETIERHANRQIKGGDVILLHDGGHLGMGADRSYTVKATDNLIAKYKQSGYEFVSVPTMMGADTRR